MSQGDALTAEIPSVTAVTALGEVLCYVTGDTPPLRAILPRIHAALPPGGVFFGDVLGPDTPAGARRRDGEGWAIEVEAQVDGDRLVRRIRLTEGGQSTEEIHVQQLFSPGELTDMFAAAGFEARFGPTLGPHQVLPGRIAWQARKA